MQLAAPQQQTGQHVILHRLGTRAGDRALQARLAVAQLQAHLLLQKQQLQRVLQHSQGHQPGVTPLVMQSQLTAHQRNTLHAPGLLILLVGVLHPVLMQRQTSWVQFSGLVGVLMVRVAAVMPMH